MKVIKNRVEYLLIPRDETKDANSWKIANLMIGVSSCSGLFYLA